MAIRTTLLMLWGLISSLSIAHAQSITPSMLREDARLSKPVTLNISHKTLYEICAAVSKETGVKIGVSEREIASGVRLSLFCEKTSLSILLEALESLFSSQGASWVWLRRQEEGAFRYQITQPESAKHRVEEIREFSLQALENYLDLLRELSAASPEIQKQSAPRIQRALYQDQPTQANYLVSQELFWHTAALYTTFIPKPYFRDFLRGHRTFTYTLKDLSPQMQDVFRAFWKSRDSLIEDPTTKEMKPEPQPQKITFSVDRKHTNRTDLLPLLTVELAGGSLGSISGSLELGMRNLIHQKWIRKGETKNHLERENRKIQALSAPPEQTAKTPFSSEESIYQAKPSLERKLLEMAQGAQTPTLILLPPNQQTTSLIPFKKTIKECFAELQEQSVAPIQKWRKGVLLINHPIWFLTEDSAVPYYYLREYLHGKPRLVALRDLAELASSLSQEQMQTLSEEYPHLEGILGLCPLLSLSKTYPDLITSTGYLLTAQQKRSLLTHPTLKNIPYLGDGTTIRLRIIENIQTSGSADWVTFSVQYSHNGDKWETGQIFQELLK